MLSLAGRSLTRCTGTEEGTYHIEFTFDADVKCSITIYYMATEDLSTGLARSVHMKRL